MGPFGALGSSPVTSPPRVVSFFTGPTTPRTADRAGDTIAEFQSG